MVCRSLLMLALPLAVFAPAVSLSQSPSDHNNVHVNNNYGVIVQENVAPPAVAEQLKKNTRKGLAWGNLLLPGDKTSPPLPSSCPKAMPEGALRVILGTYEDVICTNTYCPIITSLNQREGSMDFLRPDPQKYQSTLLSITRDKGTMTVHAELFGPDGRIEAAIEDDNRLVRNPTNTFEWRHPDAHTLEVIDDRYNKVLHMEFLNPTTLYIEGTFFNRVGQFFRVPQTTDVAVDAHNDHFSGLCSLNVTDTLF